MKLVVMGILGAIAIALIVLGIVYYKKDKFTSFYGAGTMQGKNYRYLGEVASYMVNEGGLRGEDNEECRILTEGDTKCMLIDGTPGVCNSGKCLPDFMTDLREYRDLLPYPYCTPPIFKGECSNYCKCTNNGQTTPGCMKMCLSNFSPL